jgi:hypothetical protein
MHRSPYTPPTLFLSPPDAGLPFDARLEAAKARTSVQRQLPPLASPRTPSMRIPTPKAFCPAMPDELGKWSSFFHLLSSQHSFGKICQATRGRNELNSLPPGTHPAATLLNKLRTEGVPVHFAPDTPHQDLEAALQYGCHRSASIAAGFQIVF